MGRQAGREGVLDRVLLFTDARPNTGRTDGNDFLSLVREHAQQNIGLTLFGVGLDFGVSLAGDISSLRGGNVVTLRDPEQIENIFDRDFDLLVTPILHDLRVRIRPAMGFTLIGSYGFPEPSSRPEPEERSPGFRIASLFLSRKKGGALALRLERDETDLTLDSPELVRIDLSFTTPAGREITRSLIVTHRGLFPDPAESYFSGPGVRKLTALLDLTLSLKRICLAFHQTGADRDEEGILRELARIEELLLGEALALEDPSLAQEAEQVARLADNVRRRVLEAARRTDPS